MTLRTALSAIAAAVLPFTATAASAQSDDASHRWAIAAGLGGTTLYDTSPDGQDFYISDDEGNNFFVVGDYFIAKKIALTGGLYFQQDGLATDLASGIGLKKVNRLGVTAGAKAYFLPVKWIIQPHVGVNLRTNVLNLGTAKGTEKFLLTDGYPGNSLQLDYDVQCPALSVNPNIGVDIRLLSTLSLTVDCNLYYGLWGHSRSDLRFLSGSMVGQHALHTDGNLSTGFNIGLKMDFPTKKVSETARNNLLTMLFYLLAPNRY